PAAAVAAKDAESLERLGQGGRMPGPAEPAQRADHAGAARERGAARVRAELAPPREPRDDQARENAEHELRDDRRDEKARPVTALGAEHDAVDDEADDARQENDERVHDALQQSERDHV